MSENNLIPKCIAMINDIIINKEILTEDIINIIESELNIILPNDFKKLNAIHRYDYLLDAGFEFYGLKIDNDYGVINRTKNLRKLHNLANEYLILANDGVSVVLFQTISETESKIIWCDYVDLLNLMDGKRMKCDPIIYNSFAEFYKFLLDEEQKRQKEEND